MPHLVLLGDSVFDNGPYVPANGTTADHARRRLGPAGWQVTLAARDGAYTTDVVRQLSMMPTGATHLFVSAGGNDALGAALVLTEPAATVGDALEQLAQHIDHFRESYRAMVRVLLSARLPVGVCTVYDAVPELGPAERTALGLFNDVIVREATAAGLTVLDLRRVCDLPGHFSERSSIEPSVAGSQRIAEGLAAALLSPQQGARVLP